MRSGTAMRRTSRGRRTMYSPFSENITTIVNSRAIRVSGLMRGTKFRLYQSVPLARTRATRVRNPARNGIQINEDALCNLRHGHMDHRAAKAKLGGKDRNEYPGVERVEKNLEE